MKEKLFFLLDFIFFFLYFCIKNIHHFVERSRKVKIIACNMMDEVEGNGGSFRINEMERMLGIPVIPISAMKNEGVDELVQHAIHVAKYREKPLRKDFCSPSEHGGAVHRCLHAIMHLTEDHAQRAGIPVRFAAGKLMEGDPRVIQALALTDNEQQTVEHILCQMEEERRLCYVAITRAMRQLHIVCARQRMLFGRTTANKVSRFVDEIPEEHIEKRNAQRPSHNAERRPETQFAAKSRYASARQYSMNAPAHRPAPPSAPSAQAKPVSRTARVCRRRMAMMPSSISGFLSGSGWWSIPL